MASIRAHISHGTVVQEVAGWFGVVTGGEAAAAARVLSSLRFLGQTAVCLPVPRTLRSQLCGAVTFQRRSPDGGAVAVCQMRANKSQMGPGAGIAIYMGFAELFNAVNEHVGHPPARCRCRCRVFCRSCHWQWCRLGPAVCTGMRIGVGHFSYNI